MSSPEDEKARLTDLAMVRQTLARELETINTYEEYAARATSEDVRIFFRHLADDEKEHVAEATALMRALDQVQEHYFQQDVSVEHMKGGHGFRSPTANAAPPAPNPAPSPQPEPSAPAPRPTAWLTVGSLKRRGDV